MEGGSALSTRSRAIGLAQEAARVGAQQIDLAAYRAGTTVTLDASAAAGAAQNFLREAGADGTVRVDGNTVTVIASLNYDFVLLPLGTRALRGSASASPHTSA
nr:hypothetical protein [Nocardiopsis mwathae]